LFILLARMQICSVCSEPTPKYKCPACKIRYCSLGCYKTHKVTMLLVLFICPVFCSHRRLRCQDCSPSPESRQKEPLIAYNRGVKLPCPNYNRFSLVFSETWTVEDLLHEEDIIDKVPLQRLKLLGQSKELRDVLCNPHLRELLRSIDGADSKADAMKAAMQEPLFVEFSDRCLKIVENEAKSCNEDEVF
uniref:Zinc finger HIT domain-containing protein 3 n=1 Tax=Gasterosteus aculeatus TaxID=69293 RepID=G3QA33_GASAC